MNVLIQCKEGDKRSALLVIAFIMQKYKINWDKAIEFVKSKRGNVVVSEESIGELRECEEKLHSDKWSSPLNIVFPVLIEFFCFTAENKKNRPSFTFLGLLWTSDGSNDYNQKLKCRLISISTNAISSTTSPPSNANFRIKTTAQLNTTKWTKHSPMQPNKYQIYHSVPQNGSLVQHVPRPTTQSKGICLV